MTDSRKVVSPFLDDVIRHAIDQSKAESKLDELIKKAFEMKFLQDPNVCLRSSFEQESMMASKIKECSEKKLEYSVLMDCFSSMSQSMSADDYFSVKVQVFQAAREKYKTEYFHRLKRIIFLGFLALRFPLFPEHEKTAHEFAVKKEFPLFEKLLFELERSEKVTQAINFVFSSPKDDLTFHVASLIDEIKKAVDDKNFQELQRFLAANKATGLNKDVLIKIIALQAKYFFCGYGPIILQIYPQHKELMEYFGAKAKLPMTKSQLLRTVPQGVTVGAVTRQVIPQHPQPMTFTNQPEIKKSATGRSSTPSPAASKFPPDMSKLTGVHSPFLVDSVQRAVTFFQETKQDAKLNSLLKTALFPTKGKIVSYSEEEESKVKSCKEQKIECEILLKSLGESRDDVNCHEMKQEIFSAARAQLKATPGRQLSAILSFGFLALQFPEASLYAEIAFGYANLKDLPLFESLFFVLAESDLFRLALNHVHGFPGSDLSKDINVVLGEINKIMQGSPNHPKEFKDLLDKLKEIQFPEIIPQIIKIQARQFLITYRPFFVRMAPNLASFFDMYLGTKTGLMIQSDPSGRGQAARPSILKAGSEGNLSAVPPYSPRQFRPAPMFAPIVNAASPAAQLQQKR